MQLDLFAGSCPPVPDPAVEQLLVALTPEAMAGLEAAGRAYALPENYYSYQQLDQWMQQHSRIEWFCTKVDEVLEGMIADQALGELAPARTLRYYFKLLIDPLLVRAFEADRIIAATQPRRIRYWPDAEPGFVEGGDLYGYPDLFGAVLAAVAGAAGIEVRRQPVTRAAEPSGCRRTDGVPVRMPPWYSRQGLAGRVAGYWPFASWRGKKAVLTTPNCSLAGDLSALGYTMSHLPRGRSGDDLQPWPAAWPAPEEVIMSLNQNRDIGEMFTVGNTDLFPVLEPGLRMFLERLPSLREYYLRLGRTIRDGRIRAVVLDTFSATAGNEFPLAARAGRRAGIPCVSAQHGSDGIYSRPFQTHFLELPFATTHLVWGRGIMNCLHELYGADNTAVFGYTLDRLIPQPPADGPPVIVCALRDFRHAYPLLAWDDPVWNYSSRTYWQFARELVDRLCRQRGQCRIVIKLHPAERAGTVRLFRDRYERADGMVRVISNGQSFEKLAVTASLLVFDWLGTPFFKAAPLDAGIIVWSLTRHDPAAERAARRRAAFAASGEEFENLLAEFARSGRRPGTAEAQPFIAEYLNNLGHDRSALVNALAGGRQ